MQNFTIQNGRPLLQIMITRRVSSNSAHQESLTGRAGSSGNPRSSATPVGCHSGLRLLRVGFGKVRTCKTAGHRRPGRERFEAFGRGPQLCTAQAGAGNRYPGSGKEVCLGVPWHVQAVKETRTCSCQTTWSGAWLRPPNAARFRPINKSTQYTSDASELLLHTSGAWE